MTPAFETFLRILLSANVLFSATQLPGYCGPSYDSIPPLSPSLSNGGKIQLQQISLMIRHGDRIMGSGGVCWPGDTAVYDCSNSDTLSIPDDLSFQSSNPPRLFRTSYMNGRNVYPGTCLIGQLTKIGEQQHQHNGKMLRTAYIENNPFLSADFNESEVFLRSDNVPRTIQSLQELISTMYPIKSGASEPQILNINSMDTATDDLYIGANVCPKAQENTQASYSSPQYQEYANEVQNPLLDEFRKITGTTSLQINSLGYLFDCMSVHICHGFAIPQGITPEFYANLSAAHTLGWDLTTYYPNVTTGTKLGIGFILQEIYQTMQKHISADPTSTKFNVYSAHDTTVMPMLVALGVWDGVWTPYASMLHLELYADVTTSNSNGGGWYVRFIYNGQVLKAGWCGSAELCPFASFSQRVTEMTSQNPSVDCN